MTLILCAGHTCADEIIYGYEGDVWPWQAGWISDPCPDACSQLVEDGHFVLRWHDWASHVQLLHLLAQPGEKDPPSLWVEWRFRSNHEFPWHTYNCDARFRVQYAGIIDRINTYGDATISGSGDDVLCCYDLTEFHTFRFESADRENYTFWVDGRLFRSGYSPAYEGGTCNLLIVSDGGCAGDDQLPIVNEWDFVRYGTLSAGEQIVASNPSSGFLDARVYGPLDRFTVIFNQPGYVYIDDVDVLISGGVKPAVFATRRRENGPPDELEIVLDPPAPFHARTTFFFETGGPVPEVVSFVYAPGDTDGDGDADLADFSYLQKCFGWLLTSPNPLLGKEGGIGPCLALDVNEDGVVDADDYVSFLSAAANP